MSRWRIDVGLYALAAVFAGLTVVISSIPLYRTWGQGAAGVYAAAAVASLLLARIARRRPRAARWGRGLVLVAVALAATVLPLLVQADLATDGNPAAHSQPEVRVVERAGARLASDQSLYPVVTPGSPYQEIFPYLPAMAVFGLPSTLAHRAGHQGPFGDARVAWGVATLLFVGLALSLAPPGEARFRALALMTALPTAALPLSTGGDDLPVLAGLLLGLVLLHRRRPGLAGLALGAAAALKFTAWPILLLAPLVARDRTGRRKRASAWLAAAAGAVMLPTLLPSAISDPAGFVQNVIRFPLGLAGVASPAASPLLGHLLVDAFPGMHRFYVVLLAVAGVLTLAALGWWLWTRDDGGVAALAGSVGLGALLAIVLAPATRFGYLVYPVDLVAWWWMLGGRLPRRRNARPTEVPEVSLASA
ncbi:MAG: glycosyltransferase 87 family protein [Actinomycetes bacterium]